MAIDVQPISGGFIHSKWKEQFASSSLNKRPVGVVAPGIYRGLILEADPLLGDRTVVVATDPVKIDHVAVYETSDGFSVNYRDATTGDITLDLSGFASVTVVVALFISYEVGADTAGTFRVFGDTEFDALATAVRDELVVLGTVVVPASGAIAAGSITLDRRTLASANIQQGTIQQAPIIRNGSFELAEDSAIYRDSAVFWEKSITGGIGVWRTVSADSNSGLKCIQLETSTTPVTGRLTQELGTVIEEGTVLTVKVAVKQLQTVISGDFRLFFDWGGADGSVLSTTNLNLNAGVDVGWREISTFIAVPAGVFSLRAAGVDVNTLLPSSTGQFARIDDLNILIEPLDPQFPYPFSDENRSQVSTTAVVVNDANAGALSSKAAVLRYDATTPSTEGTLEVEPRDNNDLPPALGLMGRVLGLGDGLRSVVGDAIKARVASTPAVGGVSTYTLMWESVIGGTQGARFYVKDTGDYILTANARWTGSDWTKDVGGTSAVKASLTGPSFTVESQATGTNTWADGAWTETTLATNAIAAAIQVTKTLQVVTGDLDVTAGDVNVTAGGVNVDVGNLEVTAGTGHFGSTLTADAQIEGKTSLLLGEDLKGSLANALVARVAANRAPDATSIRTLIAEFPGGAAANAYNTRFYVSSVNSETFEITLNARWDATGFWKKDHVGSNSSQYSFNRNTLHMSHRGTTDTWDDTDSASGWNNGVFDLFLALNSILSLGNSSNASSGQIVLDNGRIQFAGSGTTMNPAAVTDFYNYLTALNVPKMWCKITAPSEGNAALIDGFNCDGVSNSGGKVQVNIGSSIGNSDYAIIFEDDAASSGGITSQSNASFVTTYNYTAPEFFGYSLYIIVMGRMA